MKVRGLQKYQEEMNQCFQDQKGAEKNIQLASILMNDKEMAILSDLITETERDLNLSYDDKTEKIKNLKAKEAELRKVSNEEETTLNKLKLKKEELMNQS